MSDRSRWQSEESFEVPQTPLIDIIFILIIFFLVATTFYSEERDVEVKLPEGSEGTIITRDNSRMVINVRQGGVLSSTTPFCHSSNWTVNYRTTVRRNRRTSRSAATRAPITDES